MRTSIYTVLVLISLVGNLAGMDGVEWWKELSPFETVTVTLTNITVKVIDSEGVSEWGIGFSGEKYRGRILVPGEEIVLVPDQAVRFRVRRDFRIAFTPVVYKDQHKGFRITRMGTSIHARSFPHTITYLALSDTPMEVGEEDMKLTWEDEKWVMAEESQSFVVEKLGWDAETLVSEADEIMRTPEMMERVLRNERMAKIWNILVEKGIIKQEPPPAIEIETTPSVEPTPSHDELPPVTVTEPKPSRTLLVLLCGLATLGLCAVVYVVLKKRK